MSNDEQAEKEFLEQTRDMEPVSLEVLPSAFRMSSDIKEIAAALCKAQAEFEGAKKQSANPAYRSKYADLASVIDAMLPPLNKHGIAVLQPWRVEKLNGSSWVTVITRLQHQSGQYYESEASMPAVQRERFDAQTIGSAITYLRRYSLQSFGCLASEDDDGNAAAGVGSREQAQAVAEKKISDLKAKKEKASETVPGRVETIFYTMPESHRGNYAEFLNLKEFTADHPSQAEELRLVFSQYMSKQFARTGAVLVPAEKMQKLLEILAGNMAIDVKLLENPPEAK